MTTLAAIRNDADTARYPRGALAGCRSALVVFAAAFHGRQDCVAIMEAGLTATCVDRDAGKLGAMVLAYPEGWEYVIGDAYDYAEMTERQWDVVSLDPYTNQFQECADRLDMWCELARRAVVLGSGPLTVVDPPAGWRVTASVPRSRFGGGTFWTVLERC